MTCSLFLAAVDPFTMNETEMGFLESVHATLVGSMSPGVRAKVVSPVAGSVMKDCDCWLVPTVGEKVSSSRRSER
jgi:hypothetical protein